jgi:hypothetical protein
MGSAAVALLLSWRLKSAGVNGPSKLGLANIRSQYVRTGAKIRHDSNTDLCSSLDTHLPENTVRTRLHIIVAFRLSI